jgi:thioredoxin-related protein
VGRCRARRNGCGTTNTLAVVALVLTALTLAACAADEPARAESQPPERIQAWMDTLTIPHHYDPETGFIVADEVTPLPRVYVTGDAIAPAIEEARARGQRVIVVATADRCAPCQQYKHDALNDQRVMERLAQGDIVALHIEVDRQPALGRELVGSLAIPMTYEITDAANVRTLRGQRSADDLLAFLNG